MIYSGFVSVISIKLGNPIVIQIKRRPDNNMSSIRASGNQDKVQEIDWVLLMLPLFMHPDPARSYTTNMLSYLKFKMKIYFFPVDNIGHDTEF